MPLFAGSVTMRGSWGSMWNTSASAATAQSSGEIPVSDASVPFSGCPERERFLQAVYRYAHVEFFPVEPDRPYDQSG